MNYVVSVIYSVSNVNAAAQFLTEALGFYQQQQLENGLLLDNGSVSIRLEEVGRPGRTDQGLHLELQTKEIKQASKQILSRDDVKLLFCLQQTSRTRSETLVQGPFGFTVSVTQEYDEDDLGEILPLPTSLIWDAHAEQCIQQMLLQVPLGFRDSARQRITQRAEMIAAEEGVITVHIDSAVTALAESTPEFQQKTLINALKAYGIDGEKYFCREILG